MSLTGRAQFSPKNLSKISAKCGLNEPELPLLTTNPQFSVTNNLKISLECQLKPCLGPLINASLIQWLLSTKMTLTSLDNLSNHTCSQELDLSLLVFWILENMVPAEEWMDSQHKKRSKPSKNSAKLASKRLRAFARLKTESKQWIQIWLTSMSQS